MTESIRAHVTIRGRVQGVFYRLETQNAANRIGVCGWVRNRADGSVEAVFEGEKARVDAILEWCRKGPPNSRVDEVEVDWQDPTGGYSGFEVTY